MARLMAVDNGNNTNAATWAVIDSTSFNESESSTITVTTAYTGVAWTTFTPGAITVDGIGIRISTRSGTTGTLSVELYNSTGAASVAGTEVTVNMTDVVDGASTSADGGWMFFKFSVPVTLLGATNYQLRVKTSSSSQLTIYGSTSTNNCRILRTTTTQAPVAGDDRFVMGEWTAAATTTTRTVTLDDTVLVDYGAAATSVVTPALSISAGGIVLAGTTAATTYVQKISGNVVVYNGGILRLATSGSRMPTDSSFTWTIDCVSNVDFGIDVRRKGEFTAYGESKQRWTSLTSDEAAASTSIQVTSTSGWKNNDILVFAPTGTTITQGETKTVSTVDSGVQVTLTAGLTNAHTGTGDVVGEVGNLTSNVKIVGTSATVGTYVVYKESSIGVLDNVEFQYYGSGTSNKRGVENQHSTTSTNSVTITSCSFREPSNANTTVGNLQAAGSLYYITNCVFYNTSAANTHVILTGNSATANFNFSNNCLIQAATGMTINTPTNASGTIASNRISGCNIGVTVSTTFLDASTTTLSSFIVHSNTTGGGSTTLQEKVYSSCSFICNSVSMNNFTGYSTFNTCNFIGNVTSGISLTAGASIGSRLECNNCVFRSRTSFNQPSGLVVSSQLNATYEAVFNSCTFGVTNAHSTSDVAITSYINVSQIIFNSCTFASATEISPTPAGGLTANFGTYGSMRVQRKDDTDGAHTMYVRYATIAPDTSIFRTASPSLKATPYGASTYLSSTQLATFKAYVNNGQTCTPTLYVRESVVGDGTDYNGARIKLYVKTNYNLGITSDTLLDTATGSSEGAWEALTGTTAAVTDDGVLEFYVTFDGSTGWINLDDFSYTAA